MSERSLLGDLILRLELENVLFHEAALLDEERFEEWLQLLADNVHYWAPVRTARERGLENPLDPSRWAFFDETREDLKRRVARIQTGVTLTEEPPARMRHNISNVRILATDSDLVNVASNFFVFRSQTDRERLFFVGSREDRWRRTSSGWRLEERRVTLDHQSVETITVFF
jgi:3-phenylpropionate/trans-cinnamate dioxygenase beta subunit